MAKLYFRYGAMGSSKTANALMVEYNYRERGKRALLTKPAADTRDGEKIVSSRMGLKENCIWMEEVMEMPEAEILKYDCMIVDEAQFCSKEQVIFRSSATDCVPISEIICSRAACGFWHGQIRSRRSRPCAGVEELQNAMPDSIRTGSCVRENRLFWAAMIPMWHCAENTGAKET